MHKSAARLLIGLAVAVVGTLLTLAGGCARYDQHVLRVNGPLLLIVHARGFQIYSRVTAADAGNVTGWTLSAPDAELSSDDGVKGKHYAGPTWETADGTKVVGVKIAEHPSPDPNAVPWLLLKIVSHQGNGPIGAATYVRRINTTGGKLPEDRPKETNEIHVPYTADYIFYGPGSTTRP